MTEKLKKEIEKLKEEVKEIKKLLKSKGPIEYLEYICPSCAPGEIHKFPRIPGTKHYLHWLLSVDHTYYHYVLEITKNGSIDVYIEKVNLSENKKVYRLKPPMDKKPL